MKGFGHFRDNNLIHERASFVTQYISVSQANLDDRRFCFHFFQSPPGALIDSVKRFGIVSPPLVRIHADTFQILDGFRRVESARILGINNILCNVCETDIDEEELALFLVSVFLAPHPPHVLDQARLLAALSEVLSPEQVINDILPLLGHPPSQKMLQRLIPLAGLDEKLGIALLADKINQDMALRLLGLNPSERRLLGELFLFFSFSQSKQFEILENLGDLSKKEKRPLASLLKEAGWKGCSASSEKEEKARRGEMLRLRIRALRYPILSDMESSWKDTLKALRIPPAISLSPPPFFEGGVYRIGFSFKDGKGFKDRLSELEKLQENDEWKRLFS